MEKIKEETESEVVAEVLGDGKRLVSSVVDFLQCPYDVNHQILPSLMPNHLLRCRLKHANKLKNQGLEMNFLECPWSRTHVVPEMELRYHSNQCEFRGMIKPRRDSYNVYCPLEPDYTGLENLTGNISVQGPSHHQKRDRVRKKLMTSGSRKRSTTSSQPQKDDNAEDSFRFFDLISGPFWDNNSNSLNKIPPSVLAATPKEFPSVSVPDALDDDMIAVFVDDPLKLGPSGNGNGNHPRTHSSELSPSPQVNQDPTKAE